ncbi:MAG TPA: hypothetical protein VFP54_01215 [Acidimicrobiales bacterium]|nr:hypothetical protein [Acidimicrobiales bacterium]
MATTNDGGGDEHPDLFEYLADKRGAIEELLAGFDSEDWAQRGATVQLVVVHEANLDAVRSEILRPLLKDDADHPELLRRFDELRERRTAPMATLDELTVAVGPADVFQSHPEELLQAIGELRKQIIEYDRWEDEELVSYLKDRLDDDEARGLGARAEKIARLLPSHTHPGRGPADERSWPTKIVEAVTDRLKDAATHPRNALEGGGESGP